LSPLLALLIMLSMLLICKPPDTVYCMHWAREGEGMEEDIAVVLYENGMHLRGQALTVYGPQAIAAVPARARLVCRSTSLVVCCRLRTCECGAAMSAVTRAPACLPD
jgi:hypothetical protein